MILSTLAGLAAGATHALTGPDHVAAVLPLAAEDPRRATSIGFTWALGHGLGTILLVATVFLVKTQLDLEGLGVHMERVVGLVLVATGGWTVIRAIRSGGVHEHRHGRRLAAGVGTLHGLAGGTHVMVAISALALPFATAAEWIGSFVLGAAIAMTSIGWGLQQVGGRAMGRLKLLQIVAGVAAIVVGVAWAALA